MPSLHRFPPYVIAAAVLFMITFYHVYNIRSKNSDLERNVKVFKVGIFMNNDRRVEMCCFRTWYDVELTSFVQNFAPFYRKQLLDALVSLVVN